MKSHHSFSIVPFLVLVLFSLLSDQLLAGEKAEEQQATKVIECSFIHWDDIPERKLYFRMGEEYHPIEFKRGKRAGMISLKRMAKFEIFRQLKDLAQGELPYEFLASVAVPAKINKALFVVIAPDNEDDGGHRVVVLDDSPDVFQSSTFLFVNLAGQMLNVDFAGESQDIESDKTRVMPSRVTENGGLVPFIVTDEKGQRIYENRFFCQRTARNVVFIAAPKDQRTGHRIKLWTQLLASEVPPPPGQQ